MTGETNETGETSETTQPLLQARDHHVASTGNAAVVPSLRLYDPVSSLLIRKEVAEGYLVLLSGGLLTAATLEKRRKTGAKKLKPKKSPNEGEGESSGESSSQACGTGSGGTPEEAIHLAFVSITDGNVVDSTLGVHTIGGSKRSKDTSTYAYNESQEVKIALRDAAESSPSDSFPRLAVETYQRCFEIVVEYHHRIDDLGLITWCYKQQAVEKDSMDDLEDAFSQLQEAVEAAT